MAKYYSSTFGKISGKHGSAVAVIRKDGSTYLRLHVPASNPRTEKQQAHRAKFALTSKSLVPFNPIFKETIGITNGISTARSYAFKNAIVGEYPNLSMDYEKLMFSFGTIAKLQNSSVAINENIMTVSWDFNDMYNCHGDDSVSFIIFNKDRSQSIHIEDVALRMDMNAEIEIYDSWLDNDLYLWAYVRGGDKISDSVFVRRSSEASIDPELPVVDEDVESKCVDSDVIAANKVISRKHITSSLNEAITSLIVMIYSLLALLKQLLVSVNVQDTAKMVSSKAFYITENIIENSYKESVFKLSLKSIRRREFKKLCGISQESVCPRINPCNTLLDAIVGLGYYIIIKINAKYEFKASFT